MTSPAPSGLAPGFLVAAPALTDPNFAGSLVLMAEHHGEGALGFVVNRAGPVTVADVLGERRRGSPARRGGERARRRRSCSSAGPSSPSASGSSSARGRGRRRRTGRCRSATALAWAARASCSRRSCALRAPATRSCSCSDTRVGADAGRAGDRRRRVGAARAGRQRSRVRRAAGAALGGGGAPARAGAGGVPRRRAARRRHPGLRRRPRSCACAPTPRRASRAASAPSCALPFLDDRLVRSVSIRSGRRAAPVRARCYRDRHADSRRGARGAPRKERKNDARRTGEGEGDRAGRLVHREGLRQGLDHAPRQRGGAREGRPGGLHGLGLARHRARRRRAAARPHHRDLRPGVLGQDDPRPPRHRRGPEEGRHRRVRGRRARARRGLRAQARRAHRRPPHLAARHRRAGARDRRDARPLRRDRRARHRLGRRARAEGRARGRDGRRAHGPAGAAHEPGAAQAHRHDLQVLRRSSSSSTRSA